MPTRCASSSSRWCSSRGYTRRAEPFQLSSGGTSHDYVDLRRAVALGDDLRLGAEAVIAHVATLGVDFDVVGGMTMGADPVAHAVALLSGRAWFSVRKTEKQHGTRRRIEGGEVGPGVRVLLFEDTISTGRSILEALQVVRDAGAEVVLACTLLDRGRRRGELRRDGHPLLTDPHLPRPRHRADRRAVARGGARRGRARAAWRRPCPRGRGSDPGQVDILDAVIIVLVALAAARGLRLGAAIQLVSFCGFLLGLVFGAVLVVLIDPHVHGQLPKTFVALVLLMVPATLVAGLGRQLGVRAWRVLRQFRFGPLDAAGGALIAIAGTLVVCWLFASILVNSAFPAVSRQIADSRIIRGVEAVLPPAPDAFAAVQRYLSTSGFPQVLVNILPENDGPVSLPSAAELRSAVARAGGATVKVVAIGCGQEQEGSGFVASPTSS